MAIAREVIGPTGQSIPINQGFSTANIAGGASAISTIANAYSAFEAGRLRQIAYDHQAVMAELNAKQREIDAIFAVSDRKEELAKTLALQNVIAAASGRSGGSLEAITQTSIAGIEKEKKRIELGVESRKISDMMRADSARFAGDSARSQSLIDSVSQLTTGLTSAYKFIK